jgi:hypothetical protein
LRLSFTTDVVNRGSKKGPRTVHSPA